MPSQSRDCRVAWVSNDYAELEHILHPGGCTWYRQRLPGNVTPGATFGLPAWTGQHGYGVRQADRAMFGFDVVILKQVMSRQTPHQIRAAQQLGQIIVVDVDDYYPGLDETNKAWAYLDPARNRAQNVDLHEQAVMLADVVTVSTPFLLHHYTSLRDNVFMVRNAVQPAMFDPWDRRHRPRPVIGWVGATGWRSRDLEQLAEWLPGFVVEHDLDVLHAGHMDGETPFSDLTGVDPARVRTLPMVPIHAYGGLFRMDVGLVPLAQSEFNEAKSFLKGLEYAAAGIPFVASPTGEYRLLESEGVGVTAHGPDEWREAVAGLLDRRHRRFTAAAARRVVLDRHTITARAPEWVDVLQPLMSNRAKVGSVVMPWTVL